MIGFLKKDLLMIKSNLKTMAIIFIVFLFMAIEGQGNFAFIPAFISIVLMMSTFSYDEYNQTNAFISTLPNGRKSAVKAKYLTTLLIVLFSVIISFLISFIAGSIKHQLNVEEIVSTTIGCCIGVLLLQAILYPVIFKCGIEKARIGIFIFVFAIVGISSLLMKSGIHVNLSQNLLLILERYWMIIFLLMMILILFISYKISERIYLKKEF